jgi:hypothetical protein
VILGFRWSPLNGLWFSTRAFLLGFLAGYISLCHTIDAFLTLLRRKKDPPARPPPGRTCVPPRPRAARRRCQSSSTGRGNLGIQRGGCRRGGDHEIPRVEEDEIRWGWASKRRRGRRRLGWPPRSSLVAFSTDVLFMVTARQCSSVPPFRGI